MYDLYGSELSLFTRKLEAALRFYGVPFAFHNKRASPRRLEIEARAGTHQVPVLITPENWALADTTPIIDLLDHRFPARRLFPEGALGVLTHIVEDCLDEWVARVMVHYRWHYPDSARFAASVIAGGDAQAAEQISAWGPRACRATGTETVFHQRAAEDEYRQLLAAAEAQLADTRFLLGDRPTAVDCMFLGGLHAHTLHDPDPRKIVLGYPRIVAWHAQNTAPDFASQAWAADATWAPFPDSTPFARHVLRLTADQYRPFLLANAQALTTGSRAFTVDTYGEPASYLCRPYPEQARTMIRQRIANRLDAPTGGVVQRWLADLGLSDVFDSRAPAR